MDLEEIDARLIRFPLWNK